MRRQRSWIRLQRTAQHLLRARAIVIGQQGVGFEDVRLGRLRRRLENRISAFERVIHTALAQRQAYLPETRRGVVWNRLQSRIERLRSLHRVTTGEKGLANVRSY